MGYRRGLGRGLSSLIPNKQQKYSTLKIPAHPSSGRGIPLGSKKVEVVYINPKQVSANPYQPRTKFEKDKLTELADSIRLHGILNPLIVTVGSAGSYQLISGERRLRAVLDLGLAEVPVIIRTADNLAKLELSLIENIQREDLNPLDLALACQRLIDEFSLTQEELAKKIGKSRSFIANSLRLLRLPKEIQNSLREGEINEGQAKVILSLADAKSQLNLWKKITLNKLTVRAAEREAKHILVRSHPRQVKMRDVNLLARQERLEEKLGTKVTIKGTLDKGIILVDYFSREELESIIAGW